VDECKPLELGRKQFDDTVGADLVSQCARPGSRLAVGPGKYRSPRTHVIGCQVSQDMWDQKAFR